LIKIRECHKLKTWQPYFDDIASGKKTFDIRKDDRNFQVGDSLLLLEWSPEKENYTGLFLHFEVIYKLDGGKFGLEEGYHCLNIKLIPNEKEHIQNETT